jgi:IclR family acetate operon transcriptional repressor
VELPGRVEDPGPGASGARRAVRYNWTGHDVGFSERPRGAVPAAAMSPPDGGGARGRSGRVGSVARAVAVLEALAREPGGLGVSALARSIGVDTSTASRLLATLEEGGLVRRSGRGPFRLGLRLLALADAVSEGLEVREVAAPVLRELVAATVETATLSVPGAGAAVTVDFVSGPGDVVTRARLGRPSVPHATAVGKVLLAFDRGRALPAAGLARYTERTIVDPGTLEDQLASVRRRGWAEAIGERDRDLNAIAAPVFARDGSLAAIVGVQGPAGRLTRARMRELREPLLGAARTITEALGGEVPRAS